MALVLFGAISLLAKELLGALTRCPTLAELKPMRTKRPLALLTPAIVLEVASHMAMGVALGLGFAFILTHIAAFGVCALIDLASDAENPMQVFVMTCVTTFAIGATFTGIVFMTMKDGD